MCKYNKNILTHTNKPKTFNPNLNLFTTISIILLLFFAIIPYASLKSWLEAVVFVAIFCLEGFMIFQKKLSVLKAEYKKILMPIILLAVYSFIQGFITLLIHTQNLSSFAIFPYSLDLMASFWSAVKILAFVSFIRLLSVYFRSNIKLLVWSLIITGNFFAVLGIFRFLVQLNFPNTFKYFIFPQLLPNVGFGTYINQNHFALLMLMTIGLNICILLYGKLERRKQFFLLLFSLLSWTALILSGSRGGIFSSFAEIAVLIFFPINKGHRSTVDTSKKNLPTTLALGRKSMIFAFVSLILITSIIFIGQDRVINRFGKLSLQFEEINKSNAYRRIDVYKATSEMIRENPFYGVGFGGFRFAVSRYIDISGEIVPEQAHNDYLEYVASGGIIAIILGIWFFFRFFLLVKKRFNEPSTCFKNAAHLGAICGITAVALHSLFDFGLQILANLLFFAAMLVIAIHQNNTKSDKEDTGSTHISLMDKILFNKYLNIILFICLIIVSTFFGYSRFKLSHIKTSNWLNSATIWSFNFPFDAAFYDKKSDAYRKTGNDKEATKNLQQAIRYRPDDYNLWLKSGRIWQDESQNENAANSFRRSIELAPHYGKPHFYYGKFLVKNNSQDAGFQELRLALQYNPNLFYYISLIAWNQANGDGAKTIEYLSPKTSSEINLLNTFFLTKSDYQSIVSLTCENKAVKQIDRDAIIERLLKIRKFSFAQQIYACSNSPE